jgi:hypothetical protein
MVSEKIAAAAQAAAAAALAAGNGIETAATIALAPIKRAVRANHRRLFSCQADRYGCVAPAPTAAGRVSPTPPIGRIVRLGVVTDAAGLPRRFASPSTSV